MTNQAFAVYALHEANKDEVCFVVIAENIERMGWPLLGKFGRTLWERYKPLRLAQLGTAPDRDVGYIDAFGPARSLPPG